jgi:CheY-like chemotaxis protein
MKIVLQIEDNFANRLLIERVFETMPEYKLIQANDGESGVELALEQKPDLILIDMGLPDIDGQTVVTIRRQIPDLAKSRLVAITAWPVEKAVEMVARYGLDGCITKPIDIRNFPNPLAQYF